MIGFLNDFINLPTDIITAGGKISYLIVEQSGSDKLVIILVGLVGIPVRILIKTTDCSSYRDSVHTGYSFPWKSCGSNKAASGSHP